MGAELHSAAQQQDYLLLLFWHAALICCQVTIAGNWQRLLLVKLLVALI